MAQDVADHHLAAGLAGLGGDAFCVGDRGGERLLDEDMGAGLHRQAGVIRVAVGIGGDAGEVGLQSCESLGEVGGEGVVAQGFGQVHGGAVHEARRSRRRGRHGRRGRG